MNGKKYLLAAECFKWDEAEYNANGTLRVAIRHGLPWALVTIKGVPDAELEPLMPVMFDGTEGINLAIWEQLGIILPFEPGMDYAIEPNVVDEWFHTPTGEVKRSIFHGAKTVVTPIKAKGKDKGESAKALEVGAAALAGIAAGFASVADELAAESSSEGPVL